VKGKKKNEVLTRQERRQSIRPDVFSFSPPHIFIRQLPTHIAHIAKAPRANAETKVLSKKAILTPHKEVLYLHF